jgi:hypothetical protein
MATSILTTTVEEICARGIQPDTDIRSDAFYRAVMEELVARGAVASCPFRHSGEQIDAISPRSAPPKMVGQWSAGP